MIWQKHKDIYLVQKIQCLMHIPYSCHNGLYACGSGAYSREQCKFFYDKEKDSDYSIDFYREPTRTYYPPIEDSRELEDEEYSDDMIEYSDDEATPVEPVGDYKEMMEGY